MKKLITFFALLLILGWGAMAQTATAPSGSGTSENPYQIATLANLYWLSQNSTEWSKYYTQTANIDASATASWFSNAGWLPIELFQGTYDGGGKTISGLTISRGATDYIGLFGKTNGATLKNIGLVIILLLFDNTTKYVPLEKL